MSTCRKSKCGKRLPGIERNGWKFSLLCDLLEGHKGQCIPDDLDVLADVFAVVAVIPHQWWCGNREPCTCIETWKTKMAGAIKSKERTDPDGTIELMLEQARANDRRTMRAVYGQRD